MAMKDKPGLAIAFGMGPPGAAHDEDSEHDAARDMLVSALHDTGIKGEEASGLVDALHEYIESCVAKSREPKPESDEGEGEGEEY
jgi:hypothetical protein